MGWMHDTLHYMQEDPMYRRWHHDSMTFGLVYAFSERFVLPLSHDEVVYGKGSLIGKMPGDRWQRFANLRAYFGFMWTHPGKKLLFMGGEFAQEREWNHDTGLDWHLLDDPRHAGMQRLVRDLNSAYRDTAALARARLRGRGLPLGGDGRPRPERVRISPLGRPAGRARARRVQFHPHTATRLSCRGAARRRVARDRQHRRGVPTAGSNIGNGGEVRAEETESARPARISNAELAASRDHRIARRIDDHTISTTPFHSAAELQSDGTARFRLWAPGAANVALEIEGQTPVPMQSEEGGWVSARAKCAAGARYRYRVKDDLAVPDPASRRQRRGRARCERRR